MILLKRKKTSPHARDLKTRGYEAKAPIPTYNYLTSPDQIRKKMGDICT